VTAHRGDSKHAPENTLAAFDLAIKNGADVIELDVRETKDGKIIVTHDKNLKRTTGIDAYVEDLTYGEIRQFDAGSWFSEEYKGEQIPTLREAIELIKGRAKLNIELKPDVQNKHLEESVAELIEEYDLYKKCVVTSLNYKSIKKIKEIDSRIETVYVMSAAGGNYYDLKYADNYSINYRFIDDQVMRNCKQRGKEVYAWTVNSSEELESVMMVGVDNVITDDPGFVKDSMYESYNNGLFSYLVARLAFK
jgi:glycerophosphoryl diester phosphodiesterase